MCQGFNHFSGFLHHLVLAKLATSSIRGIVGLPGFHHHCWAKVRMSAPAMFEKEFLYLIFLPNKIL